MPPSSQASSAAEHRLLGVDQAVAVDGAEALPQLVVDRAADGLAVAQLRREPHALRGPRALRQEDRTAELVGPVALVGAAEPGRREVAVVTEGQPLAALEAG